MIIIQLKMSHVILKRLMCTSARLLVNPTGWSRSEGRAGHQLIQKHWCDTLWFNL